MVSKTVKIDSKRKHYARLKDGILWQCKYIDTMDCMSSMQAKLGNYNGEDSSYAQ